VLLLVATPVSWLVAGGLLAADVTLRATVTGLPTPTWHGVIVVVAYYVDDALVFFGIVRMAQIVGDVEEAREQAVGLAAARERLDAGDALQAAVGERLAGIATSVAAARRVLVRDADRARAHVAAAGAAARAAVADARAVAGSRTAAQKAELATEPGRQAVIGARLAWAVLVTTLLMFSSIGVQAPFIIAPVPQSWPCPPWTSW
jgi:hypothetical protein